jgi:hypothetical protein
MLVFYLLLAGLVLELLIYVPGFWRIRRPLAAILAIFLVATGIFAARTSPIFWPVDFIMLFRILNQLRIVKGRMHPEFLRRATFRTSAWLALTQIWIFMAASASALLLRPHNVLWLVGWAQVVVATILFLSTLYSVIRTRHKPVAQYYSDKELPTVTIAIPARNETTDLEACLRSVIATDYPKLEIIVLDDCSQDKTAEVIRGFAHDGVRFIKGAEPDEHWLAKNQAYEQLSEEALGELILFCGVDTRFGQQTIRAIVTTMLNRDKDMIGLIPRRLTNTPAAAFIQPMRYWWELALPRRLFNKPSVLSTCWIIRRKVLKQLGGFAAVSRTVLPERYFARELVKTDAYSFIRADDILDVQTAKSLKEQRTTAVRMRYPQVHRRPEMVLAITLVEVICMLAPFALIPVGLLLHFGTVIWIYIVAALLLVFTHVLILAVTNPPNIPLAFLNYPVVIMTEIYLSYESMFKYEFSRVDWKDRNICIPVMHVIPKLPDIKS